MELIREMILKDLTKHRTKKNGSAILSEEAETELNELAEEITAKVAQALKIKEYPGCR